MSSKNGMDYLSASNDMRVIDALDTSKRGVDIERDLDMPYGTVREILKRLRAADVIERCRPFGHYRLTEI